MDGTNSRRFWRKKEEEEEEGEAIDRGRGGG